MERKTLQAAAYNRVNTVDNNLDKKKQWIFCLVKHAAFRGDLLYIRNGFVIIKQQQFFGDNRNKKRAGVPY